MAGFENDVLVCSNVNFNPALPKPHPGLITLDGQLIIGTTALNAGGTHLNIGVITSTTLTVGYSSPNITIEAGPTVPITFQEDVGSATALANVLKIVGGTGISTSGAGNTVTISFTGGAGAVTAFDVDAHTAPGTDPVVATAGGLVTVTGGQVAAGVIGANVIRTDSLAANTYTIEIQRSTAVGATNSVNNGVSHFNNTFFTVDANAFVSANTAAFILSVNVDAHTAPGTDPVLPDASGILTVTGAQVAAGVVGANVIRTDSLAANTYTIEIQRSAAVGASASVNNGVSHFDSTFFTVDGNGFVSLAGGGTSISFNVDAHTAPGTDPVVPDGSGVVTVTGGQVAAGVVGANVIRTDSLAANTYTIEIQRTAAVGASASINNGVSHFDSAAFDVDANGFVQLNGGGIAITSVNVDAATVPGTDPVLPTAAGQITITGGQVATGVVGTNVIRTDSLAANTFTIEIQRTTAVASTTAAVNGVSHFDSAAFDVDANGFVQLNGGGVAATLFNVDAHTAPGTDPVVPDATGQVTITGAQVASGVIGANVIRTDSLAANTYTIEIQRSTAVAASDSTKNGVAHFDSSQFTVDSNGFVQATGVIPPPLSVLSITDDFLYTTFTGVGAIQQGDFNWQTAGGGVTFTTVATVANHPGILGMSAGGTYIAKVADTTGGTGTTTLGPIPVGAGEIIFTAVVRIPVLSSGGSRFPVWVGFTDSAISSLSTEPTNGAYFFYQDNVNAGAWVGRTANGGVRTSANSAVTVTAGTWFVLKIVINSANTSIGFFINGTEITGSPITTNITSNPLNPTASIQGSSGGGRFLHLDLIDIQYTLSGNRF